jgi:hypothetical protein
MISIKDLDIVISDESLVELGGKLGREPLLVTISPNSRTVHNCIRKNPNTGHKVKVKLPYGIMNHEEQYEYLEGYIKQVILPYLTEPILVYTYELNENANLHVHMIVSDKYITNDVDLNVFRRAVASDALTMINMGVHGTKDYMNNIVRIDKPLIEVMHYLFKDYSKTARHFKGRTNLKV